MSLLTSIGPTSLPRSDLLPQLLDWLCANPVSTPSGSRVFLVFLALAEDFLLLFDMKATNPILTAAVISRPRRSFKNPRALA